MILECMAVGPFMSNCYIVGSEKSKEGIVIDPSAEHDKILARIKKLGLNIKLIVTTHNHVDHIGAISYVKESTGAKFASHGAARSEEVTKRYARLMGPSFRMPPQPDIIVEDGDYLEVGDLKFLVIHTPGHAPDGISLFGHGVVFTGDALFNMSIGRTDFPDSDFDQLMHSIFNKIITLPDDTIVLSGHGPESTIGFERKHNPFLF
ncbi:MAG: MBL fold metallo-hydrolase [Chloroflexi bacterium]|nr:MBL fold metallo-hydrolase [Chloroflexota bacterium]